jgi:hypothetical protein
MIYRIVALLLPLTVCMYRVSQVLPPDRKHTLLIDLKFAKNSGMIVYRCRTFCKNLNFFTLIYIIFSFKHLGKIWCY